MSDKRGVVGNMAESLEHDLEMDSDFEDVEEDANSLTPDSIASASKYGGSFKTFTYVNGRRYHNGIGNNEYFLPNDEKEQDRLDLYHYVFLLLSHGKLHLAPLREEEVKMVLDVGTGTGIWAIEFAGEYPDAHVIGTDISPIQPSWVPPQLTFEMVDMEEPWEKFYKPNTFDYIHIRTMSGCFKDWDKILSQAMKHSKPGGYVEFQDFGCEVFHTSGKVPDGSKINEFCVLCNSAGELSGRPLEIARTMKERMIRLGFEDVHENIFIWPWGPWPKDKHMKELGRIGLIALAGSTEAYGLELLSKYHKMSVESILQLCEDAKQEGKTTKGLYSDLFFVYGRKPLGRGD